MPVKGPMWDWKLGQPRFETSAQKCYDYALTLQATDPVRAAKWFDLASIPVPLVLATDYGSAHGPSGVASVLDYCIPLGLVPQFWIYSIPNRNQSGGGASSEAAYKAFIDAIVAVIVARGNPRCIFEIEPDALPKMYALPGGLAGAESLMRQRCLAYACAQLRSVGSNVRIYINAGNSNFRPKAEVASLLPPSGIADANGIALNTAQSYTIPANHQFGLDVKALEPLVGGWMISCTKIGPYVRQAGDRVNAAYYNEPVLGTLDGTGGRPNRPTMGITMGPRPTLSHDMGPVPGLHGLWYSKAPGTSDDAWPKVGDLPDLPAVDAPGPGKSYFSYWETAYDATVGVDWSQWRAYPWGAAARSRHLRRTR